jgi:hypothetical protein
MKRLALAGLFAGLLAAACGSGEIVATSTVPPPQPDSAAQLNALESARVLWEAAPADYTVSMAGETLAVRGDEVVSLAAAESTTIEEVFGTIERSIRDGAVVHVEYDDEFGFPTRVVIDLDGDGIPDVDLTFSDLEAMPVVETREELLAAEALWEAQDLDTYRYIFRADCTCPDGGTFDVDVRDNRVTHVVPLDDGAEASLLTPTSIAVAFDDLEEWFTNSADLIDEGIAAVDVRMDPALGYPRWFHVEASAIDGGPFEGPFSIVVTIDLVLPYVPIDDGVDDTPPDEDEQEFVAARARWEEADLNDYSYLLILHCECPLSTSGPFEVKVKGGELRSVTHTGDLEGARPDVVMIDDLLEVIAVAVAAGIDVDVTYDDDLGYPSMAIIDTEAVAVDGGLAFSVADFEIAGEAETPDAAGQGAIAGTVLAGPQCPVQQDPPQPGCEDQPVVNVPVFVGPALGDGLVPMTYTDDMGTYRLSLMPGDYVVTVQSLDEYMGTPEIIEVTVEAGTLTEINFYYDTGIR